MPFRAYGAAGYSLTEVLIAIAVIGIFAAIAMPSISGNRSSAETVKLQSDVKTINQAIQVYLANGGNLDGVTDPQAILNKLKTTRTVESAAKFAGLSDSMIDQRLAANMVNSGEANRAVWQADKLKFTIASVGMGVREFYLNEQLATVEISSEERQGSAVDYNVDNGWIWAYSETAPTAAPGPTQIPVANPGPPSRPPLPPVVSPPVTLPLIAVADAFTIPEDTSLSGLSVLANDVGSNLSIFSFTSPAQGSLQVGSNGSLSFVPPS